MSTNGKTASKMTVPQLHHAAMEAFDQARTWEQAGDSIKAEGLYRSALAKESEAAARVASKLEFEPTRSVLHRSAAAIALRCREFRQAERLISVALSGNPHEEIAEELRALLDQVNFDRHMQLRGLRLARNEMQLSIAGEAVGDGVAQSDEFVERVQVAEKILIRTIERRSGKPFRETGRAIKEISDRYQLYLSAARAGSFTVTLRIGLPDAQLYLEGMEDAASESAGVIVQAVLDCLEAFNESQDGRLRDLIPQADYRRNFVALARQLAPDGNRVRLVGITTQDMESTRKVAITRPRKEVTFEELGELKNEVIEVSGLLLFANATSRSNMIRIVDEAQDQHRFVVPTGMMADIVRPLWESRVKAIGVRRGKRKVELLQIDPLRDSINPEAQKNRPAES